MADNTTITQGTIESLDNCYALKINGAQGKAFFFMPSNPKEQIAALEELNKYAKDNKIEIMNKAEYPTLSNNIELVAEQNKVKEVKNILEGMASIIYGKLTDGDKDLTLDQLLDKANKFKDNLIHKPEEERQANLSTTFEPNPMVKVLPVDLKALFNDAAEKCNSLIKDDTKFILSKEEGKDLNPKLEKDGKSIFESQETFNVMAGLELVLESKLYDILALGYTKGDVQKMLNHIVENID